MFNCTLWKATHRIHLNGVIYEVMQVSSGEAFSFEEWKEGWSAEWRIENDQAFHGDSKFPAERVERKVA